MTTHERHLKSAKGLFALCDLKMGPRRIKVHLFKPPGRFFPEAIQCRPTGGLAYEFSHDGIAVIADQEGFLRHGRHKVDKGLFHMGQARVDIGMVKFDASENGPGWGIMEKLWSLVKEGRIIFVSFDDKVRPSANVIIAIEVFQDATHHEAWIEACYGQDPRQEGRGRGLAMGPGYYECPLAMNKEPV